MWLWLEVTEETESSSLVLLGEGIWPNKQWAQPASNANPIYCNPMEKPIIVMRQAERETDFSILTYYQWYLLLSVYSRQYVGDDDCVEGRKANNL